MVSEKWTLLCAVIGSAQINQIHELDIQPNLELALEYGGGQVDPTFAGINSEQPLCRFSTTALKRLLAAVNINSGQALSSGTTAKLYFQQMAPGGTRKTGSTCMTVTVTTGIAVISGGRAADGGAAMMEVLIYATSVDGDTAPLTYATGVALPTLLAADQLYTIGQVSIAGALVGGVESIAVDPKISVSRNRGDGEPYPTFAFIMRRGTEQGGPSLVFTTRTVSFAAAGTTQAVTGTTYVALRAMKNGATREALTALKHIKLTPNDGVIVVESIRSADGSEALLGVSINAIQTASLPAISVTVDQALA